MGMPKSPGDPRHKWVPATGGSYGKGFVRNPTSNPIKATGPAFWVTNLTNMNVSLADLDLTIKAFSSVNLLDSRHYDFTLEQLEKSYASGSLYKKRDRIVRRKIEPEILQANLPLIKETFIPTRERSVLEIKETKYEELEITDEEFAKENAETAAMDEQKPLVASNHKRG